MAILGLDLGSSCGWAVRDNDGRLHSGTWKLKPGGKDVDRTTGLMFWRRLNGTHEAHGIQMIGYESVMAHGRKEETTVKCLCHGQKHRVLITQTNALAAHKYGGFQDILEMFADFHKIPIHSIHVSTLKKFATGNGRAKKEEMIAMAKMRWRDQRIGDKEHDRADALHVLDWLETEKARNETKTKKQGLDMRKLRLG